MKKVRDKCECAGIGRQARLRGVCFTTYGFKSRHSHHRKDLIPCVSSLFYFMQASDDGTWRRPLRKQSGGLFLGRALMKVWRWTSRIGEVVSLTYCNHRHSQVTVISICISEYDGERVTVKIKVDRRKQLFLGRALMKVWRWTSRIGEDGSMTYSNFSISTGKTAETLARHRQTQLNV